eukprot:jgi/Chlat1/8067/Chrsp73S07529
MAAAAVALAQVVSGCGAQLNSHHGRSKLHLQRQRRPAFRSKRRPVTPLLCLPADRCALPTAAPPPSDSDSLGSLDGWDSFRAKQNADEAELRRKQLISSLQVAREHTLDESLLDTPLHPRALRALYISYGASCAVERTWRFAVPLCLAQMPNGIMSVAALGLVGQATMFLGGPWIGQVLDSSPRVPMLTALLSVQATAVAVAGAALFFALSRGAALAARAGRPLVQPWFWLLMGASMVERLCSLGSDVAFERDWVVQLAGPKRPRSLAKANATLRRLDLTCEVIGPIIVGAALAALQPKLCVGVIAGGVVASLPVQLYFMHRVRRWAAKALERDIIKDAMERAVHFAQPHKRGLPKHTSSSLSWLHALQSKQGLLAPLHTMMQSWKVYVSQPMAGASMAYVLLYFNAVLTPSGVLSAFLTQKGLPPSAVGAFRGSCAFVGFCSTLISPLIISRLGIVNTAATALLMKAACLAVSVATFFASGSASSQGPLIVLMLCVVASRLFLYVHDVAHLQIHQTAVPRELAGTVSSTEAAMCSLAEVGMLGVTLLADRFGGFNFLVCMSLAAVMSSAGSFLAWAQRTQQSERSPFYRPALA